MGAVKTYDVGRVHECGVLMILILLTGKVLGILFRTVNPDSVNLHVVCTGACGDL